MDKGYRNLFVYIMDLQQHNELFCSELWLDNHCFMLRKWSPMELITRYSWQPLILSCSKENLSCAFNCNQSLTSRNRYTCMPLHLTTKLNIYKNNAYLYLELKPSHQFSPNVTMFMSYSIFTIKCTYEFHWWNGMYITGYTDTLNTTTYLYTHVSLSQQTCLFC